VCRVAERVGAWVIADEIYRGAEREADDTPSIWDCGYERAVVSSGLSKAYGLPGLRIGWIVAPPTLVDELWGPRLHDDRSRRHQRPPGPHRAGAGTARNAARAHARHHPRQLSAREALDREAGRAQPRRPRSWRDRLR